MRRPPAGTQKSDIFPAERLALAGLKKWEEKK